MNKLTLIYNILKNQGPKYAAYRLSYEVRRRSGLLKSKYPIAPEPKEFITLQAWRAEKPKFFFENKESIQLLKTPNAILEEKYLNFLQGKILFFNAYYQHVGLPIDWVINPDNGYKYSIKDHWTTIEDFTKEAGDIKFVWEKSRFTFLMDLIRYDYHHDKDCSELVFSTIDNWMDSNPINMGPNYRCSQEISIRILHWTFALYYYSESSSLTESRFSRIMHFIYWQLHHVRKNILFSKICVRNNHAVTEVMMLYFSGLLFPFMPNTEKWKRLGKNWLEKEIAYQVYEDGTYLQFSHNYQRVLVQLLTLSQLLANLHNENFSEKFISRSRSVVDYLRTVIDPVTGWLPNYGANDGALFFRLNDNTYRDYRPQLNALYFANYSGSLYPEHTEDIEWLNTRSPVKQVSPSPYPPTGRSSFPVGGIYTFRDAESFTFIKCATYKDRPSHADNLHLDIWYKGQNLIRDAGTYKYNTEKKLSSYFNGTRAHNSVTLGDYDQMIKGARFIWMDWSKAIEPAWKEEGAEISFTGSIYAFSQIKKGIIHRRTVEKIHDIPEWWITDEINESTEYPLKQWWHPMPEFLDYFLIQAFDENNVQIPMQLEDGYYSSHYGVLENTKDLVFITPGKKIITQISARMGIFDSTIDIN